MKGEKRGKREEREKRKGKRDESGPTCYVGVMSILNGHFNIVDHFNGLSHCRC